MGRLLSDAMQMSSHVGSFPIREMWSGLRPATPDDLPILGASAVEGLLYAIGHYRNGILLAPVSAAIIASLASGAGPGLAGLAGLAIEGFAPGRFNV